MARRATVIKSARSTAEHHLLLDAGNSLLKDEDPAQSSRGATSIAAMNLLGYDAMTLGSLDISQLTLDELRQRMQEAEFAILSANAYIQGTGDLVAEPYKILEMGDRRVAILGLTDPPDDAGPPDAEIAVADPLQAAQEYVPELAKAADIILLLSHAGLQVDRAIAEQVTGVDVIVSGGNVSLDEPLIAEATGALVLHADTALPGNAGKRIGLAHLGFGAEGNLLTHDWTKILLLSDYPVDDEVQNWLTELSR